MNQFEESVRISAEEIAKNILGYESDAQYGDSQPSFTDDVDRISAVIKWHMDEACNRRAPEPGTSVIRWTRYDGTPETLPDLDQMILVHWINEIQIRIVHSGIHKLFDVGDLWAYLPEPTEGME